jgi:S-formylglutathione hydrolase FrmB
VDARYLHPYLRRALANRFLIAVGAVAILAAVAVLPNLLSDGQGKQTEFQVVRSQRLSPRLLQFTIRTPALSADTHVRVLVPRGYWQNRRRYPVLYLLHGARSDYTTWTSLARGVKITKGYPLIVVMPDGGSLGFYSDWYNDGEGGPPRWEDFHIDELVPWVDSRFRTRASRKSRAIAGVSMGGFGALSYAARHPNLFSVAASYSGAVDSNYLPFFPVFEAAKTDDDNPAVWGPRDENEQRWREHNPWDLAANLRDVHVLLFTGNGQPGGPLEGTPEELQVETEIEQMNISLDARLTSLDIPHSLIDYGPGAHNLLYAERDLAWTLPVLKRLLARNPGIESHGLAPRT